MAAPAKPVPDPAPSEAADKGLLVFAFLLGVCGAFVLKFHLGMSPVSVALWAAFVLLAYAAAAWWIGRERRTETEIIGDNCYYLGFVFTLVSLAGTLYLLAKTEAQADALRDVISGFGVALTSTILGIVLRVLHIRMSPNIAPLRRETRRELYVAVRDFRTHLSASIRDLKHFSIETMQLLNEQRNEMHTASKATIEAQRQALEAGVEGHTTMTRDVLTAATDKTTRAVADAFADSVAASHQEFLASVAQMREAVADLARKESETLQKLVDDSSAISSESAKVRDELAQLAHRLEAVSAHLETATRHISDKLEPATNALVKETQKRNRREGGFWRRALFFGRRSNG